MTNPVCQLVDRCESTNTLARALAESGAPHGSWVSARVQESGRGRHGRSWQSIEGNLFLSLVVRIESPQLWTWIPWVAGVAVARLLRRQLKGLEIQLKWPNDLRISGSKLGGILCEGVLGRDAPFVIVGLGLNCIDSPRITDQPATSLTEEWAKFDPTRRIFADEVRKGVVDEILLALDELKTSGASAFLNDFETYSEIAPGDEIQWGDLGSSELHQGIALGLGYQGELRVRENGVEKLLTSEEVKLRLR